MFCRNYGGKILTDCIGICIKYKANKVFGQLRYATGQKRCTRCEMWMQWDGKRCPCCSRQLKTRPRNSKHKAKFKEAVK